MKICINAGHDRKLDPGAINRTDGTKECDLAGDLGVRVKAYLEALDTEVILVQDDDLYFVCNTANDSDADLFVSLHFNAFNGRASGVETLIYGSSQSLILGHCIQSNLRAVLDIPDRGIKERPGLFVLRNTTMPAVIVETCFLDNDYDLKAYRDNEDAVARAIATGIIQYPGRAALHLAA